MLGTTKLFSEHIKPALARDQAAAYGAVLSGLFFDVVNHDGQAQLIASTPDRLNAANFFVANGQ